MTTPEIILHATDFILAMLVLLGSPFYLRFFLKKCLDSDSNPLAVLYFFATALSLVAYGEVGLIVYSFVVARS